MLQNLKMCKARNNLLNNALHENSWEKQAKTRSILVNKNIVKKSKKTHQYL